MRTIGWACALALALGCGTGGGGQADGGGSTLPPLQHTLHLSVTGSGEIRASAPPFTCRADCSQVVASSASVHLDAIADAGWQFDGWHGACSGTGPCDVAMSADHDVSASFSQQAPPPAGNVRVAVNFVGTGSGRVVSTPAGIDCPDHSCSAAVPSGTALTLMATPDSTSSFTGWGGGCSGNGVCSLTASADLTVWANFTANPPPPPGPPPQCSGIAAPDAVALQQYVARPSRNVDCLPGLGDANGTLAFPMAYRASDFHGSIIDFVGGSGAFLRENSFDSEAPGMIQQPNGFLSAGAPPHLWPYASVVDMRRWDTAGNVLSSDALWYAKNFAAAPDPRGGLLLAGDLAPPASGFTSTPPYQHEVLMFVAGGRPYDVQWGLRPLASPGAVFGAGVDLLGHSLVITDGSGRFGAGTISAQWFDHDGTPLTGEFALVTGFVPGPSTWFETSPLINGGLVVRRMDLDGTLRAHALVLVDSGTPLVHPAPQWMVDRPDTRLQIARDAKGYAVLPYGRTSVSCSERLEIVAPDGTSCGAIDYPIAAGTCDTRGLTLAEDGTVIQQLPLAMEATVDTPLLVHSCTWRYFRRAAH